jgi:hypothetical protein
MRKGFRRFVLSLPFAVALALTILISCADLLHLRLERIAGYGFLFATPWAWLLDHDWLGNVHMRWLQSVIDYVVLLWIPALLYSGTLWLLMRLLGLITKRARG